MGNKQLKQYNTFLYSGTITCLISGALFSKEIIKIGSTQTIKIIATSLFIISYFLLLVIGKKLKEKEIYGIQEIAWAIFILFIQLWYDTTSNQLWIEIIAAITKFILIFTLVDGVILLIRSIVIKLQKMNKEQKKTIDSVEAIIATTTSVVAIIISIIEMF